MLTKNQLDGFDQNGFLVIDHVLDDHDIAPLEQEYAELLGAKCQMLFQQGRIPSKFEEYGFAERFALTLSACPDCVDDFNISLPLVNGKVEADKYHVHSGPAVFWLLRNDKILDVVEAIIGSEICSSPVLQMRIKPPQQALDEENIAHSNIGVTTWHQDTVAVLPEADDTNQVTVWVAITDSDEENGCLVSIPGSHREGPKRHQPGEIAREPTIPESIINGRKGMPLPVKRGGLVIFHKQNIHCSLPNHSDRLRWSVDLRYHPAGQPSGRPAFPGFVARSQSNPELELKDPMVWKRLWDDARTRIIRGQYSGPIFRDWDNTCK